MSNNETLADVLAEMRRHIQAVRDYPQDIDVTENDVELWADRIEAAYARDTGNVAALREAVGNALWCLNWMDENTGDRPTKEHLAKPIELLTAALSSPPRNCDRFSRWETAKKVFEAENWQRLGHINPYRDVIKWLFAPAEGKEASNG